MKIYVLRHGLTELNKKKIVNGEIDEPLAEEGVIQAREIVGSMPRTIGKIYTSPLIRAKTTAEVINKDLNLPIITQNELTEIKMGSLAGKSWDEMENGLELKKKHRAVQFDYRETGGESVQDVKKRLIAFFKHINGVYNDYEVLVITHGGIIRMLYMLANGELVYETEKHVSLLEFDGDMIIKNS